MNNFQVYDIEVFAEKWKDERIIEEARIHNKGNRKYWNLGKSDESIGIRVNFDPQALETSKDTLPKMMCFAWCNSEMLDTAPLKETHRVALEAMNKLVEKRCQKYFELMKCLNIILIHIKFGIKFVFLDFILFIEMCLKNNNF